MEFLSFHPGIYSTETISFFVSAVANPSFCSKDIENIYSLVQAFIEREIIEEEDGDDSNESLNVEEFEEEE